MQEVAFTLANAIAYVEAATAAGLDVNRLGQRMSFFFAAHNDFLEEIAKFRAARRLWARIMRDRFGATDPRAQQLRFHTQTAGSTLTAQQPDNNIVRVAMQALAAVLGGTQSLHCNGRDEALALPTEESARDRAADAADHRARDRASRTPSTRSAGAYAIEARTNEIEREARQTLDTDRRDRRHACGDRSGLDSARDPGVGLSGAAGDRRRSASGRRRQRYAGNHGPEAGPGLDLLHIDPAIERRQVARVKALRASRGTGQWHAALGAVAAAARGSDNLVPPIIAAVEAKATVGEIADTLRGVFGEHQEIDT